jgi:two-component system, NtrC family, sensor kinase
VTEPPPTAHSGARAETESPPSLRVMLDAIPLGIVLLDADAKILYANRAERERRGEGSDWFGGRDFFELVGVESSELAERYRREVAGDGVHIGGTLKLGGNEDGSVAVSVSYLAGPGRTRGIAVVEEASALTRERERRERAERLAAVGSVAAGVAHEVNNPLASIKSFAQLLARDATRRDQREALELIINESTRVATIVDNLLSYARQQGAGGLEPVNLSAVAERVLQTQRYALQTAGITVRRDFDRSVSPVMGEVGALQQVVLNLIVNAEQALATSGGDRRLIVRTRESSEGVILSVIDNGPGIPREILPKVFERFTTTKPNGTGLGLAISAAIVRDHSGQIWAESDEGRGAAFYVRLPRSEDAVPKQSAPLAPPAAPGMPDKQPRRQLRVLVADDEIGLRRALALFLERRGHVVIQAADAHEAFALATTQPFDVALVDARMPGDGLVLLEKLEAIPALQGRTALMTGDLGRARTHQGITTGRPYLSKPFDMDEMVRLLESLAS